MIISCQDIQFHEHTKLPSHFDSQNTWCLVFSFHTSFIPCFPRSFIRIRTVSSFIHRIFAGLKQNRSRAFLFQEFQTNFYHMRKNLDARSTSVSVKPFSAVIHIPECFIYLFFYLNLSMALYFRIVEKVVCYAKLATCPLPLGCRQNANYPDIFHLSFHSKGRRLL